MFNVTLVGPYNDSTTVVNLSVIMALFVQMDLVSYCKQPPNSKLVYNSAISE